MLSIGQGLHLSYSDIADSHDNLSTIAITIEASKTDYAELEEITVGHWSFSVHIAQMAKLSCI